ncbi:MAG: hypothetical protein ACTSO9_14790 [Candidatus Helarchaeota archaeon]
MKIRDSHILALIYIFVPVVFIFLPLNLEPVINYIYLTGIGMYFFSGIILFYGTIRISELILKISLLIGIVSWVVLLVVGVFAAIYNNNIIQIWHLINTLESAKLINPVIEIDLPSYIISELLYGMNITYVINSIVIILLTIAGALISIFAFQKKSQNIAELTEGKN